MLSYQKFTFNPVAENTYVVYNDLGDAIIIDPGCYFEAEREELQQFLTEKKLKAVQLINTHCHLDHVFGNKWVAATYGLELYIHPNEEMVLGFAPQSGERWGLPFENYQGPLHFLNEGDVVKLGDDELKVILAPGHSPGSICLYAEREKFVVAGDVLFRESIGRTDLPGGNHQALLDSIRDKMYVLPDDVTVLPGHNENTTIGHEKKFNPYVRG